MKPKGFTHTPPANAPRYNLVEKPITQEQALHERLEQVKRLSEELETLLTSSLPTTERVFEKAEDGMFEEGIIVHPLNTSEFREERDSIYEWKLKKRK